MAISTRSVDFPTLKLAGFGLALGRKEIFQFFNGNLSRRARAEQAAAFHSLKIRRRRREKKKKKREREREDLDRAQHNGVLSRRERERERD